WVRAMPGGRSRPGTLRMGRQAMRHTIAGLLLAACGLLLGSGASARVPEMPRLRHIDVAAGLPSSAVNSLTFEPEGYLWLATADGLARYDGVGMQVWRHDPANPRSLPANYPSVVHVDPHWRGRESPKLHGLNVPDSSHEGLRHCRLGTQQQMGSNG